MLRSNLSLWAYTPPTAAFPLALNDYGERIEALEFSTVAPGGFGDLACVLKLPDAWLPRPELGIFSLVALRDGLFTCFGGEWSDPALVLGDAQGEYMMLSALGGDILSWRVMPSAQRAYNAVQVAFVDLVAGPGSVTVSDPRRAGNRAVPQAQAAAQPGQPATDLDPGDGHRQRLAQQLQQPDLEDRGRTAGSP